MTGLARVTITRSGTGWLVACPCGWERMATRRPGADRVAYDHRATHGRPGKGD